MSTGAEGPFVVPLHTLEEGNNPILLSGGAADLQINRDEAVLHEPVRLEAQAYRNGDRVDIQGEITARAELSCDRCLEPVPLDLRAPLRVFAERKESRDRRSDEELREEDTGIVYHDGLSLDLTEEVRQLLLLDLPWHVLCREDCRGLCPGCGKDRNRESCDCRVNRGDSRWDSLRSDPS